MKAKSLRQVCSPGDVSSTFQFCNQVKNFTFFHDTLPTSARPGCHQSLGMDARAADLVSHLTLEEKQSILDNGAAAVSKIGLPAYQWWSEGLHGPLEPCVSDGGVTKCPTNFPAASAMAAAFNVSLYLAVGRCNLESATTQLHHPIHSATT